MKTIPVATFDTLAQAEPLRRQLMDSHISAWIHEGSPLKSLWFMDRPKAEVQLEVKPKDFKRALRLMQKLDSENVLSRRMLRCPECHSSRIEYPQFTRKFFLPNLVGVLSGLGLVEKKYYCEDCHYTWSPRDHKPEKKRAHMAPDYFLEGVPKKN